MGVTPSIRPGQATINLGPFTPVKNYINHIVLVLDASGSMQGITRDVVKVADQEIQHLAQQSQKMDQETRVTVYTFASRGQFKCLIFDKDVLRLPSIATLYRADGNTALIDATLQAITELGQTCTLHGDHAFLIYVLTDGQENHSLNRPDALRAAIAKLPDNWTFAAFVPDKQGVNAAMGCGFPAGNVAVWTGDAAGMNDVGDTIRTATANYMDYRSKGIRGTKSLFHVATPDTSAVKQKLDELHFGQYRQFDVDVDGAVIAPFVELKTGRAYRTGEAYYELMKDEKVQASKAVVIKDRKTHKLYRGPQARAVLGLPDYEVKVAGDQFAAWQIFVQSTSVNRKLPKGTSLIVLS